MSSRSCQKRRVVIGFDLRRLPIYGLALPTTGSDCGKSENHAAGFLPSIDTDVWPSFLSEDDGGRCRFGYTNPLNLLGLPDFWTADEATRIQFLPVAFDLPVVFLEAIGRGDHVTQIEIHALESLVGWNLLGFDVVDKYVSYSVASSPHLRDAHAVLSPLHSADILPSGLFATYEAAIAASREAEAIEALREHAPFSPCGVWTKARRTWSPMPTTSPTG